MCSRVIAVVTATLLLLCGVLAARHEAHIVHVRNSAGAYVHGSALSEHHDGQSSDVHGQRNSGADTGECALLTAFDQPVSAEVTALAVVTTTRTSDRQDTPITAIPVVSAAVYHLAPKTSPPIAA